MKHYPTLIRHLIREGRLLTYLKFLLIRHRRTLAYLFVIGVSLYNFHQVGRSFDALHKSRTERIAAQAETDRLICQGQVRALTNDLDNAVLQKALLRGSGRLAEKEGRATPMSRRVLRVGLYRIADIEERATQQLTDLGVIVLEGGQIIQNGACENLPSSKPLGK